VKHFNSEPRSVCSPQAWLQAKAKQKVKNKLMNQFDRYEQILLRENEKHNLTAITTPEEIKQKHFADSMSILAHYDIPEESRVLDVGSGGGFPGVPLKIARPDIYLTLLESSTKKCGFLKLLAGELKLDLQVTCARAEEAAHDPELREQFDVVVSRAVAALPMLCELCLPFVEVGGMFVAYKGTLEKTEQELADAANAIELLGGTMFHVKHLQQADGERTLVMIKKIKPTPEELPRKNSAMIKKAL